jgi:hypothetical protein
MEKEQFLEIALIFLLCFFYGLVVTESMYKFKGHSQIVIMLVHFVPKTETKFKQQVFVMASCCVGRL